MNYFSDSIPAKDTSVNAVNGSCKAKEIADQESKLTFEHVYFAFDCLFWT